jgi:hypothetical protein
MRQDGTGLLYPRVDVLLHYDFLSAVRFYSFSTVYPVMKPTTHVGPLPVWQRQFPQRLSAQLKCRFNDCVGYRRQLRNAFRIKRLDVQSLHATVHTTMTTGTHQSVRFAPYLHCAL